MKENTFERNIIKLLIALNLNSGEKDYSFMLMNSTIRIVLYVYILLFNCALFLEILGLMIVSNFLKLYEENHYMLYFVLIFIFIILYVYFRYIVKKSVSNLHDQIVIENEQEYKDIRSIFLLFGVVLIIFLILLLELVFR